MVFFNINIPVAVVRIRKASTIIETKISLDQEDASDTAGGTALRVTMEVPTGHHPICHSLLCNSCSYRLVWRAARR